MQALGEPSVNHNDNSTLEYSRAEGWNALSSTRCLIRGGTRCLQRVAKTDAALPPDICAFSDKADIVFRRSRSTLPPCQISSSEKSLPDHWLFISLPEWFSAGLPTLSDCFGHRYTWG